MPRLVVRLLVALLTLGLGIAASLLWNTRQQPQPQRTSPPAGFVVRISDSDSMSGTSSVSTSETSTSTAASIEAPGESYPHAIRGGILNGKAISKPQPAYPPIAKAARATGTVTVEITVDEAGHVVSARAASGHPLLQQAAVAAARQARFSPTLLSGKPVKVSGTLSYNFVLE